jgi:3-dehydroquinate dehydratase
MTDEKFIKYALLCKQISTLEAERDALKPEIQSEMEIENLQELKNEYGSFYFTTRKTWEYPEYITDKEAVFKAEKKLAEANGDAISIENKSLAFRMAKEQI